MADDAGRLRAALDRYVLTEVDDRMGWPDLAQVGGEVVNCLRNGRVLERLEAAEAVCRAAKIIDMCEEPPWSYMYDLHRALAAWERAGGEG